MAPANSGESRNQELTKNRALKADELRQRQSNERVSSVLAPTSNVRRLDVDAVLERSVRKVVSEELHSASSQTLHEVGDAAGETTETPVASPPRRVRKRKR